MSDAGKSTMEITSKSTRVLQVDVDVDMKVPPAAAPSNKKRKTCDCSAPSNTCALCLENMTGGLRNVIAALPCGHLYHEDCFAGLQASVLEKPADDEDDDEGRRNHDLKCPTCNQKVENFGRIFLNLGTVEKTETHTVSMETLVRNSTWSDDEYIVESALKRIFAIHRDSEIEFLYMGGHVAVLRAMERHSSKSLIQWYGAKIIFELSKNHISVLNAIGVSKVLLAAMRTHHSHRGILAISCAILSNTCQDNELRSVIAEQAIPLAVAAMKRFPADELVQMRGCCFLRAVTSVYPVSLGLLGRNDGIVPIVTAMKRHPSTHEIQASGCALLGELALASNDNKKVVFEHGGIVAIAAALERFHNAPHSDVRRKAEDALQRICSRSVEFLRT